MFVPVEFLEQLHAMKVYDTLRLAFVGLYQVLLQGHFQEIM